MAVQIIDDRADAMPATFPDVRDLVKDHLDRRVLAAAAVVGLVAFG